MNVYIYDESLSSGHKYRGIGSYTINLIKSLKIRSDISVFLSSENHQVPVGTDIIHYPYFDLYARTLKIHKSIPTVVTVHDVIPLVFKDKFPSGMRGYINFWFQKRSLCNAGSVITDSDCSARDIHMFLGLDTKKVHMIKLAPSKEYRELGKSEIAKLGLTKKYLLPKHYVLYVGDVNWNKNVESLIYAFKLASKNNKDLKLVLVGKAFENSEILEVKRINLLIDNLKLKKKILRLGYVSTKDLVGIFNLAIAYVQPSYYEGFGLSVLEAMACGVPVVSTTGGSLSEILGESALKTQTDAKNIAEGIGQVMHFSPTQRREIIKKGLSNAKLYTWRETAKETVSVYKSLI